MSANVIGPHATAFEEPDTIWLRLAGEVTADQGKALNQWHREYGKGCRNVFYLADFSALEGIDPVARREAAAAVQKLPVGGVAVYSASLRARVLAKLIFTPVNLFRSTADAAVPIRFFETADEARAWINGRRAELQSAA
jgi:hypothetical protein